MLATKDEPDTLPESDDHQLDARNCSARFANGDKADPEQSSGCTHRWPEPMNLPIEGKALPPFNSSLLAESRVLHMESQSSPSVGYGKPPISDASLQVERELRVDSRVGRDAKPLRNDRLPGQRR